MKIKNLISLVLSIIMVLGLCAPVLADGEVPEAVSGLEGYEKLGTSAGADLYVNKENGDVVFAIGDKVLFAQQKAEKPVKPTIEKTDKSYNSTMTEFFKYYYTTQFKSPQEYVSVTMQYQYDNGEYALFVDEITGAAAFMNLKSGQILTTNPYDVGSTKANEKTKTRLLSQFVFDYTRGSNGDTYSTFEQAAMNDQISVNRIRGGVRVEYSVGRQESRILVPMMIERSRFEQLRARITLENKNPDITKTTEQLQAQVESDLKMFDACFTPFILEERKTQEEKNSLILKYPIIKKYNFYMFNESSTRLKYRIESIIKEYTDYTFEDLQSDHELLEYQGNDADPPLFKMAIEYYLDDNGIKVRVPAKSISYNKGTFTISALQILPYLGAGNQNETGYTFYPDGSGALVRFEDIGGETKVISARVYGQDYAYHTASGQNKEVMRLPAFGVKRDENYIVVENSYTAQEEVNVDGTISYNDIIVYEGIKKSEAKRS